MIKQIRGTKKRIKDGVNDYLRNVVTSAHVHIHAYTMQERLNLKGKVI